MNDEALASPRVGPRAPGDLPAPEPEAAPARARFQGAVEILRYNWPFYATALVIVAASLAVLAWVPAPPSLKLAVAIAGALTLYLAAASLAASHLVYDRSQLCHWGWIPGKLREPPRRWALLHAGLDLGSARLKALFPGGQGRVIDFYEARTMTEPSIRRARQANAAAATSGLRSSPDSLPLASGESDAVFLLFSAHEVRDPAVRLRFFTEVARALRHGGRAILVEHLRDAANFLAFGPGFLHFLPRREWMRLAADSGLEVAEEFRFTPFVRVFVLERPR